MTTAPGSTPTILIDIGGVLGQDHLPTAAAEWSTRLDISPQTFLNALFAGNDEQVLIGRIDEATWWNIVQQRLQISTDLIIEIQRDLAARQTWDSSIVNRLRSLRGAAKTAIISNAWPHTRTRMVKADLIDLVDDIVLSCEVGYAKPDARIYIDALQRIGAEPAGALFIDDTPGHVDAARSLGMTGHIHVDAAGTIARIDNFLRPRR
jgi:putative hydrolase of the HAD superfamily